MSVWMDLEAFRLTVTRTLPILALIAGLGGCSERLADPALVASIDWNSQALPRGAILVDDPTEGQVVAIDATDESAVSLLTLESPGITATTSAYGLEGRVRYRDLGGESYLEMWSFFPDGSRYFSRTLAEAGPMQKLAGSADWREFRLPFELGEQAADPEFRPIRLTFGVVMPEGGHVEISGLELHQY